MIGLITQYGVPLNVQRLNDLPDEFGLSANREYETLKVSLIGWIQPARPTEITVYEKAGTKITHSIYFNDNPEVIIKDRLIVAGRVFTVEGSINPAEMNRFYKVFANEISHA